MDACPRGWVKTQERRVDFRLSKLPNAVPLTFTKKEKGQVLRQYAEP